MNKFNKKSALIFAGISLLIISCSPGQSYYPIPHKAPVAKETLDNGLTVLIKEEHSHPVVTVMATIGAGLSYESEFSGSGISHFVEHMIFKGTAARKPGEIEEEVKSYGGVINASTGLDSASYHITVPNEYVEEALGLMEDIVLHPAFDPEELEKEREVILKEIKLNRDDPARRVIRALWRTSYLRHPYKLPVIGHEGLFKKLKRADLVKYHIERYRPDNIVLTVAGDIEKSEMLSHIKSGFGKYERKGGSAIVAPAEPEQNALRKSEESMEINLAYLAMGYHTVELSNADLYALDVLAIVLGDWDGSRLNKKIVKDTRLLYTVSSFNYTPKYPGLFIIYGTGKDENLQKAKEKILEEVAKIARAGLKQGELRAAKNMVISGYINSLETTAGLAGAASQSEFLAGDPTFFEKYVENVKRIDNKAVKRVAGKYLRTDNLTISYLYPSAFKKGITSDRCPPRRWTKGLSTYAVDIGPQKVTLPNGIRLILKEDHRLPKVSVVCAFPGGLRVETRENNGISNLTSAMLLKGTKTRKENEIKAIVESLGGRISHFSGKNTFGVSLGFLKGSGPEALDILEDVIKNPSFPEKELEKQKEKLYAAIKSEDDDIYATGFLKLRKAVFGNHPYGLRVNGETDSLEKITPNDLRDFHGKFCVPDNMVISIVGDFETRNMQKEIEKRFGGLKRAHLNIKKAKPAPLAGVKKVSFDMPREQSLVIAGFRGTTATNPDRYALALLSSILSGENGRLYKAIRNELGLSYALGTFSVPGVDAGYIASYAATDEKHLEQAKKILLEELKKIKEGSVSEKELNLAKSSLIGRQKISLQSFGALAHRMTAGEIYGIGYDAYLNYPERITNITMADIVETARKYLDLEHVTIVTVSGKGGA